MTGQINYEDNKLGKFIVQIAENPNVKTIVEIGTWNGLGTTRCVLHGFQKANKTDYNFISILLVFISDFYFSLFLFYFLINDCISLHFVCMYILLIKPRS